MKFGKLKISIRSTASGRDPSVNWYVTIESNNCEGKCLSDDFHLTFDCVEKPLLEIEELKYDEKLAQITRHGWVLRTREIEYGDESHKKKGE